MSKLGIYYTLMLSVDCPKSQNSVPLFVNSLAIGREGFWKFASFVRSFRATIASREQKEKRSLTLIERRKGPNPKTGGGGGHTMTKNYCC